MKKVIKEYAGKEKYTSKAAMVKHKKKESKSYEKKEGKMVSKKSYKK